VLTVTTIAEFDAMQEKLGKQLTSYTNYVLGGAIGMLDSLYERYGEQDPEFL
jgi:hypothetical protein